MKANRWRKKRGEGKLLCWTQTNIVITCGFVVRGRAQVWRKVVEDYLWRRENYFRAWSLVKFFSSITKVFRTGASLSGAPGKHPNATSTPNPISTCQTFPNSPCILPSYTFNHPPLDHEFVSHKSHKTFSCSPQKQSNDKNHHRTYVRHREFAIYLRLHSIAERQQKRGEKNHYGKNNTELMCVGIWNDIKWERFSPSLMMRCRTGILSLCIISFSRCVHT
jgi:hypothetical protein